MPTSGGAGVIVFGSPVSVGHVKPLMPLARRFVERGFTVVWAISGDANEPASTWREALAGNRWKAAATSLAAHVRLENGLDAAEALVLAPR